MAAVAAIDGGYGGIRILGPDGPGGSACCGAPVLYGLAGGPGFGWLAVTVCSACGRQCARSMGGPDAEP